MSSLKQCGEEIGYPDLLLVDLRCRRLLDMGSSDGYQKESLAWGAGLVFGSVGISAQRFLFSKSGHAA